MWTLEIANLGAWQNSREKLSQDNTLLYGEVTIHVHLGKGQFGSSVVTSSFVWKKNQNLFGQRDRLIDIQIDRFSLVGFYGISNIVGYLMPNTLYPYILIINILILILFIHILLIYIYMICKHILQIRFLNKLELFCTLLNGFKHCFITSHNLTSVIYLHTVCSI